MDAERTTGRRENRSVESETLNERILQLAQAQLIPTGEFLAFEALTEALDHAGASLVGVVSLLWGCSASD